MTIFLKPFELLYRGVNRVRRALYRNGVLTPKRLARPVTLAEIKADAGFKDFPLVRIARLSVMPVTDAQWTRIEAMAAGGQR